MASFLTLTLLLFSIGGCALLCTISYPISKKWCKKICDYIVTVMSRRLFAVLKTYRNFSLICDNESKNKLPEQFILISNHQSLFDVPVFMQFFRDKQLRFIAKDGLARNVPLVSEMLRIQKHCMIPRHAKPMEAMDYIGKFGKQVREENQIPMIFPEGTRTKDGNVAKFYTAGFRKLSESSGLPVCVCALDGGWELRDLKKIFLRLKNGTYKVKVVKVYDSPKTKEECLFVLEESRELIQKQLDEWRKETVN